MRIVWLLASIGCVVFTAPFCWILVYYLLHETVTWRVIAPISAIVVWAVLTREAFVKFLGRTPNH